MSTTEPLCQLIGINPQNLSKSESLLLEAELFTRICEQLKNTFRETHKEYFDLMKLNTDKENAMLESKFVRLIIQDILSTEKYNMNGIAYYSDTPLDIIEELSSGLNTSPSAMCVRRLIELHREVRSELYNSITKKIIAEYLAVA